MKKITQYITRDANTKIVLCVYEGFLGYIEIYKYSNEGVQSITLNDNDIGRLRDALSYYDEHIEGKK